MVLNSSGRIYYVSKHGNNSDGHSWATAWNELSHINWNIVQPGDTILLDGGSSDMTYTTTLTIGKSGTAAAPITIKLASEAGRNGKAVIFGGRSTPLPYCNQDNYVYQTEGVRRSGIAIGAYSWIVIDGVKRSGLHIYGHNGSGISFNSRDASNITIRNAEVYDNGTASFQDGVWRTDDKGVMLYGTDVTFERSIIHDNGQDAFQSGGVWRFTLRDSYLYNARKDPGGQIWNYCTHPDGVQIWGGGDVDGVTIEDSVIGPGFMHGVLLGGQDNVNWAVVHNVVIRDVLFYGIGNLNISTHPDIPHTPTNWLIEHITSDKSFGGYGNVLFKGDEAQLSIRNSIFTGGYRLDVPSAGRYSGNFQYNIQSAPVIGTVADPQYADSTVHTSALPDVDFKLSPSSPAVGTGSHVTSAAQLLGEIDQLNSAVP